MEKQIKKVEKIIKEEGLTAREALDLLTHCQSLIVRNMPINKNLDSEVNWQL